MTGRPEEKLACVESCSVTKLQQKVDDVLGTVRSTARSIGQAALAISPWVPTRGPSTSASVTAQLITDEFGRRTPGAVCDSAVPLDGTTGTTDRRRLGLRWNDTGTAADLPKSVFVKSTPLSAKNRLMVAPLDMSVNEVRFYRQIRPELDGHAPKCWYTYSGPGARHLLVLEDLVAQGCTPYALADHCEVEHARAVLVAHAALHAPMWDSPRLQTDLRWAKRWSQRPGYAALLLMYRRGRNAYIKSGRRELDATAHHLVEVLNRHDTALYRALEQGPSTILHGDPHLGNTYSLPNGEAGLLDWQVVWQGPGMRDVTYFLLSALDPDERRKSQDGLIRTYLDALAERGVTAPSFDAAFQQYRLFAAELFDAGAILATWPGLQAPQNVEAVLRRGTSCFTDLDVADAVKQAAARLR
ncbi:MAG: phosphotransferase [Mycobacterium sp.]